MNEPCVSGTETRVIIAGLCVTTTTGVYVQADDYVAEMAGFDTPFGLLGKTDADMPWQGSDGSERRRMIDALCLRSGRMQLINWCMTTAGWRRYLIDQRLIHDSGQPYFHFESLDTTELCDYRHWLQRLDRDNGVLHLGPEFNNATLTQLDIQIARLRYLSYDAAYITQRMGITSRQLRRSITQWNGIRAEAERMQPAAVTEYDKHYTSIMVSTGLTEFILEQEDWFTS